MILKHPEFSFDISLQGISTLVIEQPNLFRSLVMELTAQVEGRDGQFIVYDDLKEVPLSKTLNVVHSPFAVDLNGRKMLTALTKEICENIQDEYYVEYRELEANALGFALSALKEYDTDLTYKEELAIEDYLKFLGVRFREGRYESPIESLLNHVVRCRRYLNCQMVVLINCRDFMTDAELSSFIEDALLQDVNILFVESHNNRVEFADEKVYTVDKDLCEIY